MVTDGMSITTLPAVKAEKNVSVVDINMDVRNVMETGVFTSPPLTKGVCRMGNDQEYYKWVASISGLIAIALTLAAIWWPDNDIGLRFGLTSGMFWFVAWGTAQIIKEDQSQKD